MNRTTVNKKRWWVVAVGLGIAVTSAWLFYRTMTNLQEFEPMLVASRRLEALQQIAAADLRWQQVPKGAVDARTVQDPAALIGRVAAVALVPNEAIFPERVMLPQMVVAPGERVAAVPTDLVRSVGASLRPGDRVDLWWVDRIDLPAEPLTQYSTLLELKDAQARPTAQSAPESAGSTGIVGVVQGTVSAAAGTVLAASAVTAGIPAVAIVKVQATEVGAVAKALAGGQIVLVRSGPESTVR